MKRLVFFAAAQIALGALWAQSNIVSTTVSVGPCPSEFKVDGQTYRGYASFLWPEFSKHILEPGRTDDFADGVKCQPASSWTATKTDGSTFIPADGPIVVITASPDIAAYQGISTRLFRVDLVFNNGGAGLSFSCTQGPPSGKIYVNGTCFERDGSTWLAENTVVQLQAFPPKGWAFLGWTGSMGGDSTAFQGILTAAGASTAFATSFKLLGPAVLHPLFEPAVSVYLKTVPPELTLLADRAKVQTADMPLDWARNSTHSISALSPQYDQTGGLWVWQSWAHGGNQTQIVKTDDRVGSMTFTATFVPGARVSFASNPIGLKLVIDGRDNWPTYNFTWGVGSTHSISAPLEQFDAQGRKYVFQSWSTPGGPDQQYQVADTSALGAVANYQLLGQLTIESMPGGVGVLVNGAPCRTPCVVDRKVGEQVKLAAQATVALTDSIRLDFTSWSDGGPRERTWTAGTDAARLMVTYQSSNRVQAVADPAGGATFRFDPASSDGFYAADTEVSVTVVPKPGFKFKFWEGDAGGSYVTVVVKTSSPVYLRAVLEKVPYVAPTGVSNAAGTTPESVVAPGSVIRIDGGSMAPAYEKGPDSPLAQTISGVIVQVADRILPLFFVSPEQINAQLPSDLPEGEYKLIVSGDSQPDASAKFVVQRNAPGLFAHDIESKQFALATHQDGSPVTQDDPARRGETVTLLGTGLGPYKEGSVDGFAIPDGMVLTLADPVEIRAGDKVIVPTAVVAAAHYVGITAIRFPIGADLPEATNVELKVRVNGHESNTVLLPVK